MPFLASFLYIRIMQFIAVGCTAALTHIGVVILLVEHFKLPPLYANVLGWLIAFIVSFSGHYFGTFRDQKPTQLRAAIRFFVISLSGFLVNEISYAVLLQYTWIAYDYALTGILIGVAALTYWASRRWAFLGN